MITIILFYYKHVIPSGLREPLNCTRLVLIPFHNQYTTLNVEMYKKYKLSICPYCLYCPFEGESEGLKEGYNETKHAIANKELCENYQFS
jgi:uncharacterized protein (DUF2225 family)